MLPVFRMSQSGYCPRRLSALMLNIKERLAPPPWLAPAAREGVLHERIMKEQLTAAGCEVADEQGEVSLAYPTFSLLGHMDGRVRLSKAILDSKEFEVLLVNRPHISFDSFYPLEVKSFSFNEYQRWRSGGFEVFPNYAAQETCYMAAVKSNIGVYATKDRSGGRKQLLVLGEAPGDLREVVGGLERVAESVASGEVAAAEYDNSSIECRRCEFRTTLCKSTAEIVEDEDLLEVLRSYDESREQERVSKKEMERCKELILSYGKERYRLGEFAVDIKWIDRESISLRRLLEIVEREVVEEAISSSHYPRLSVTNLEEV